MSDNFSRRDLIKRLGIGAATLALPGQLAATVRNDSATRPGARTPDDADVARLDAWSANLRSWARDRFDSSTGLRAVHVGELAVGTPYEAFTLEAYIKAGGNPEREEPIALSLTRFDCVTLVESCLAIARITLPGITPSWSGFEREVERMRYRDGIRRGYTSRLHYFSEWISDGVRRGLVKDIAKELGGIVDPRPLRFMTEHRSSYPALASDDVYREIGEMEVRLDATPRWMVPAAQIPGVVDRIESGDVIAFATDIAGLDVTHAAFAYRDQSGVLRVLHAPLSGGVVEITQTTLPEYVANIRRATGILVARPLNG